MSNLAVNPDELQQLANDQLQAADAIAHAAQATHRLNVDITSTHGAFSSGLQVRVEDFVSARKKLCTSMQNYCFYLVELLHKAGIMYTNCDSQSADIFTGSS